jgi:hypothetical protein
LQYLQIATTLQFFWTAGSLSAHLLRCQLFLHWHANGHRRDIEVEWGSERGKFADAPIGL